MEKLDGLQMALRDAEDKKADLEKQVIDCRKKLGRAEQLITGLGGEKIRWLELSKQLRNAYENIT